MMSETPSRRIVSPDSPMKFLGRTLVQRIDGWYILDRWKDRNRNEWVTRQPVESPVSIRQNKPISCKEVKEAPQ